ncbi:MULTISPECIES: MurR/RpiR family transcriptional regulator [Streptomyces]|uniref:MurR/RpiR family transcriptional regulator n=2 Tax=Streptomyces TaxID=1883 RepID=A0A0L0K6D0_9ACTN|nr:MULTISPECIES: MurR/RpiR family transcriptional regulator [Streptomyces]MBP5941681.1 MurR/RpiR family transcriptional regulator [Streptomyces sp. LBUM 1476]KND33657.1 sugar isomerase [Streptomyces acidiscabies]MBZ3913088.1 MurR/RpiR family transcriptional regulator [Streptomyces acidiscabies]MDX2958575.1 MurR/RpiR family transcriptional regulator [Streptomyces acidiscabies]MDX3020919.1 MurR/RpiR family transcriptional regulator [Streptomyces acidiscabies]
MPTTDVTTLIRTELPRLAGSLRKVGELILEDPAAVTHCSAAELGRRTGTSQATVTRFCRAIGLDSYQHLLIELAQERGRGEASDWGTAEIGPDISPDDSLERVVQVVGSADLRAIQQTVDRIDLDALERGAQALARARRIDVYGVGGSGAVAQETETRLFRIGCAVRGWTEVHGAATSAALLTPADVAIGISHSGSTRETLEPFEMAKERGATTIALTTDPRSPLARAADVRLISATSETSFRTGSIGGRHSVLMIVDCLYVRVAQLSYQRASASLALTDHITPQHAVKARRAR